MPDAAAIRRLLSYYQSPMFDDDFRRKMLAGGDKAEKYLQHLVEKMNEQFTIEGYIPTADDIALQSLFLDGSLSVDDLLEIARSFGTAGTRPSARLE